MSIFLGNLQVTSYRSVPQQTDDSPFITSTGERVCRDGVAVSQDLLQSKKVRYGDWLYIEGVGLKRVNDTMHRRHKDHIDIWVPTLKAESEFHAKFKCRKVNVWLIKSTEDN
jgi:3D (Asp-Asp-Asp) domain-containing protein